MNNKINTFKTHWMTDMKKGFSDATKFRVLYDFKKDAIKYVKKLQLGCGNENYACGKADEYQSIELCPMCERAVKEIKYLFDITEDDINDSDDTNDGKINERKLGKITVTNEYKQNMWDNLTGFVPIKVIIDDTYNTTTYLGYHKQFNKLNELDEIPYYSIIMDETKPKWFQIIKC